MSRLSAAVYARSATTLGNPAIISGRPGTAWSRDASFWSLYSKLMERPSRFEAQRFLGDKRVQVVYDLDDVDDESIIEELASGSHAQTFGPDTLAEARNRGYRLRKI